MKRTLCMLLAVLGVLGDVGCGLVGPSCHDETGEVLTVEAQVPSGGVAAYSAVSPKSSNLVMRLTWSDTDAALTLRATITDCGSHTACAKVTVTPTFGQVDHPRCPNRGRPVYRDASRRLARQNLQSGSRGRPGTRRKIQTTRHVPNRL